MSLEAYIIEVRNESRRLDWRPLPTEKPYMNRENAIKALERTNNNYGCGGMQYRISIYKRIEP